MATLTYLFATSSYQMAAAMWLLLLFFYCSKGLVSADYLASRTVDMGTSRIVSYFDALYYDNLDLALCWWFFDNTYNKSLPDNNTNFNVFRELETIFEQRDDAHCYYMLFDNSSFLVTSPSIK